MTDFDELIGDVLEIDAKKKQILATVLDEERQKQGQLIAIMACMGDVRSYTTSVSLEWMAQKVKFATELPLFREYRDPDNPHVVVVDEETAGMLQQRQPDFTRQYPMVMYLVKQPTHKYPPALLVATQPWVDNPESNAWGSDGRAIRDSIEVQSLDSKGYICALRMSADDFLFAIDGQHRLMSIRGLAELTNDGVLYAKNKMGGQKGKPLTVDELIEGSAGRITRPHLQGLLAERIAIDIIPAVVSGETREEALRRVRSIFVHVNRTAVSLTGGELALLDEDNGFAVVARRLMVSHDLLSDSTQIKKGQLSKASGDFTTLETLVSISERYLGQFEEFHTWLPDSRSEMPLRPAEESLAEGRQRLAEYFDELQRLPSHDEFLQSGSDASRFRQDDGDHDNILFRPVIQAAVAEAIGYVVRERGRSLSQVVDIMCRKESDGGFKCTEVSNPWYGVLWDPLNNKINRSGSVGKLCLQILIHLLGNGTSDDEAREELREKFAQSRRVDWESEEALSLDGQRVRPAEIELPVPWQ